MRSGDTARRSRPEEERRCREEPPSSATKASEAPSGGQVPRRCRQAGAQETLGPEPPWTERKAQRELGKRLAAVDEGFRKPDRVTFGDFAQRFVRDYLPGRNLKRSTTENYRYILDGHLLPFFGDLVLARARGPTGAHRRLRRAEGAERTLDKDDPEPPPAPERHAAPRRRLAADAHNPVSSIDRPSLVQPEMSVLTETEIARLANAYDELVSRGIRGRAPVVGARKAIVLTALGTALRRGELVGLRWGAVNLLEAKIDVRETYVRGRFTTPKSRASRRIVELGPRTLAVLEEQWHRTAYRGDDDLVFGHPTKGTPLETGKLAKRYLKPALARAGIEKPFRPFHDLRHTSLTHAAAAGNPQIYVQARAGHSQGSITERYMHAAQVLFPGAAEKSEARMFGEPRGGDAAPPPA